MSTYTDAELEKMLVDLESDLVERKQVQQGFIAVIIARGEV